LYPWGYTANAKVVDGTAKPEGFDLAAVSAPVQNAGDTIHFRYTSREAKVPNAITTACKNPEIAVQLLDYLYTDEGALLINYVSKTSAILWSTENRAIQTLSLRTPTASCPVPLL
jgi:hypothetical protein